MSRGLVIEDVPCIFIVLPCAACLMGGDRGNNTNLVSSDGEQINKRLIYENEITEEINYQFNVHTR